MYLMRSAPWWGCASAGAIRVGDLLPRLQSHISGRLPALTEGCDLVAAGLGERVGDYSALALVS